MKIEINKELNIIDLYFVDDNIRDDDLLLKLSDKFAELDRFQKIIVECHGKIYIEVAAYIVQVSEFCTMIVRLSKEDNEAKDFIDLTASTTGNKKITTIIKED